MTKESAEAVVPAPAEDGQAKARFRRWTNPYISRLSSLPDYILESDGKTLTAKELGRLKGRMEIHSHVYIELGSGSGGHLIDRAALDQSGLYVGFELRFKRVFRTAEKAKARGVTNLMIANTDARRISELFAPQSLDGVFVNFPDPWDKRRWDKHKILGPDTLMAIASLLKPGGFLWYKTDHQRRFDEVLSELSSVSSLVLDRHTHDLYATNWLHENVSTEFERLFTAQKLPVCMLRAIKSLNTAG